MSKNEKIVNLTNNKTERFSLTLNYELVKLFKNACKKNNTKPTTLVEIWMLDYLEENNML